MTKLGSHKIKFKPKWNCSSINETCNLWNVNVSMKNFDNEQQYQKEIKSIPKLEITFMNEFLDLTLVMDTFNPPPSLCHFECGQLGSPI